MSNLTKTEKRVSIVGRIMFLFAGLLCLGILIRSIANYAVYSVDSIAMFLAFGIPGIGLVSALVLAFASEAFRINAIIFCVAIGFPIWGTEVYLSLPNRSIDKTQNLTHLFAKSAGRRYDTRTALQVIQDEIAAGREVDSNATVSNIPFTHPSTGPMIIRREIPGGRYLGGSESGTYVFYKNDERGFKNPRGIWKSEDLDLAVVGDSFVKATSMPSSQDIVGVVRGSFPSSLNLGWSGTGPLTYYQMLVEYVSRLRPKFVAFVWFEGNDVTEFVRELSSPLLGGKYIGTTTPFGLYDIPDEALSAYHRNRVENIINSTVNRTIERTRQLVMLSRIRSILGLGAVGSRVFNVRYDNEIWPELPAKSFRTMLGDAKAIVEDWEGTFIFVYLPAWERVCHVMNRVKKYCPPLTHNYRRDEILAILQDLEVNVLDMTDPLMAVAKTTDIFYFPGSHYNVKGYEVVGKALVKTMRNKG